VPPAVALRRLQTLLPDSDPPPLFPQFQVLRTFTNYVGLGNAAFGGPQSVAQVREGRSSYPSDGGTGRPRGGRHPA
jgi:hypothetical protein